MDKTYYVLEHAVDYYPYGKVLREYTNCEEARYLTTQHERDQETGLDYRGARFYDSDIGRFLSLDPLAMEYPQWSDYNYVLGNPIRFVDPDGRSVDDIIVEGVKYEKGATGEGYSEFVQQTFADLNKIRETSSEGEQLVSYLENHELITEITEASSTVGSIQNFFSEGSGDDNHLFSSKTSMGMLDYAEGRPVGIKLEYSRVEGVDVDGVDSKAIEVLHHELIHADQLASDALGCLRKCGMKAPEIRGVMEAEAVQATNVFRMRIGRGNAFRQNYQGTKVVTSDNEIIPGVKIY